MFEWLLRANQMKPSQRPCTRRKLVKWSGVRIPLAQQQGWEMDLGNVHSGHWNLLESHFQYLQSINDLTVDHMLLVHTCSILQLLNKDPHYHIIFSSLLLGWIHGVYNRYNR